MSVLVWSFVQKAGTVSVKGVTLFFKLAVGTSQAQKGVVQNTGENTWDQIQLNLAQLVTRVLIEEERMQLGQVWCLYL